MLIRTVSGRVGRSHLSATPPQTLTDNGTSLYDIYYYDRKKFLIFSLELLLLLLLLIIPFFIDVIESTVDDIVKQHTSSFIVSFSDADFLPQPKMKRRLNTWLLLAAILIQVTFLLFYVLCVCLMIKRRSATTDREGSWLVLGIQKREKRRHRPPREKVGHPDADALPIPSLSLSLSFLTTSFFCNDVKTVRNVHHFFFFSFSFVITIETEEN